MNSSTMRILWISFMLLGSITCAPPKPDREQPTWWTVVSPPQQEPSKPVYQNPSGQVGCSVGHSSYPGIHYSSSTGGAISGPTYGVQHAGHQHSQHAAPGDGSSQFAEESWSSSSDTSGADEPVFSPVDEADQVYAYKSKSQYNRKRLRFSQFRYTPTEPIVLQPPVFPHHGKISHYLGKKGH